MGILDWFTQPTCEELDALALSVRDFGAHVIPLPLATGTLRPGPPGGPQLMISRAVLSSPEEVNAAATLLTTAVKSPGYLTSCAAVGWTFPVGQTRALEALTVYGQLRGFGADTVDAVTKALLAVFDNAAASKALDAPAAPVVYAAAQVVLEARTASLDAATWLPLWRWALGGPQGRAAVRTRVMTMKALQAILRRGSLTPRQVLMAASMADVLQQLVAQRAPGVPTAEQAFFRAEAQALVGAINFARAQAAAAEGLPPGATPLSPRVRTRLWAAAVTSVVVAVGAAMYYRRHA